MLITYDIRQGIKLWHTSDGMTHYTKMDKQDFFDALKQERLC